MISIKTYIISEAFEQLGESNKLSKSKFIESSNSFDIHSVLNANGDYEDLTRVVKDPSKIIVYDTWNQMLKDRDNFHTYYVRQNGDKKYEVVKYSRWSDDLYTPYVGPRGYSSLEELYARNPGKYDDENVCLVKEIHGISETIQLDNDESDYTDKKYDIKEERKNQRRKVIKEASSIVKPNGGDKKNYWMFYVGPGYPSQKEIKQFGKDNGCTTMWWGSDEAPFYNFKGTYNGDTLIVCKDVEKLPVGYKEDAKKYGELIESFRKDNLRRKKTNRMNKVAEDFEECNLTKMGTNEYEANENRDKHIKMYRKFANLNDDEIITEENINDWALQKTATTCNRHPDRIKSEILGRRYSAYEV